MGGSFLKNMDIPEFSIYCYRQIFPKIGIHGKIALFFSFCVGQNMDSPYKIGTVGKYGRILLNPL